MNFGTNYTELKAENCKRCGKEMKLGEKMTADRHNIHKTCYKCAICEKNLEHGGAGLDVSLSRYGLTWLCRDHLLMAPGEKEKLLQQKGAKKAGK